MKTLFTLLMTFFAVAVNAQSSGQVLELKEIEAPFVKCHNSKSGPEYAECTYFAFEGLSKSLQSLLNDDCRWKIFSTEADKLCGEKAQAEGSGFFYGRRLTACMVTQYLMLYGQLLDRQLGGKRQVDERLLDLMNDPDNMQILPLQELREKILDKNSKQVKCEQRPMV